MLQLQNQGNLLRFFFFINALILLQIVSEKISVPSVYIISAWLQLVSIIQHFHNLIPHYAESQH